MRCDAAISCKRPRMMLADRKCSSVVITSSIELPRNRNRSPCISRPVREQVFPLRVSPSEIGMRLLWQNADKFEHVPVKVSKVNLRRWHPPDHGGFMRFMAVESEHFNPVLI